MEPAKQRSWQVAFNESFWYLDDIIVPNKFYI